MNLHDMHELLLAEERDRFDLEGGLDRLREGLRRLDDDPVESRRIHNIVASLEAEEEAYDAGSAAVQDVQLDLAETHFRSAAGRGHPEATYELAVLLGDRGLSLSNAKVHDRAEELLSEATDLLMRAQALGVLIVTAESDRSERHLRWFDRTPIGSGSRTSMAERPLAAVVASALALSSVAVTEPLTYERHVLALLARPATLTHQPRQQRPIASNVGARPSPSVGAGATVRPASRRSTRDAEFRAAFPGLYGRAYQAAFRLLGDRAQAENVAHEALTRAYVRWSRLDERRERWVVTTTVDLVIDYHRCKRRRRMWVSPAPSDRDEADRRDLRRLLATLSARRRQAAALHYLNDRTESEVAAMLGCSIGIVKRRAAALIRHVLGRSSIGDGRLQGAAATRSSPTTT